jgi:Gpi18-like mannosyltransferase
MYHVGMKRKISKFSFIFILVFLVAFLLRCILINWTLPYGNNGDFVRYEDWARIAHINNFAATYTTPTRHSITFVTPANNEPPGTIYVLFGAYELWILVGKVISRITHMPAGSILFVNTYLQHIFMKFTPFLTDLGMGLLAYLLVAGKAGKKKGLFAASLILFNPVILYNSAVWGQMDSINNFFLILSLFFAFRKNIILSILAFSTSVYIKLSLLPLFPFYLIFLYFSSKKNIKRIFLGIALSVGVVILATLPISSNPVVWLLTVIPGIARGELQNITVAAFNFWWMILCPPSIGHKNILNINHTFLAVTLRMWAYGIFGILSLPFLRLQLIRSKELVSIRNIFLMLSVVALLVFLFFPGMHDRYMYPIFPLLAIAIGLSKQIKTYLIIFCLLSLFNLSNIAYSWYPIVLDSASTFYHIFYGDYFGWIISILTMVVAGWFYWKSLAGIKKVE